MNTFHGQYTVLQEPLSTVTIRPSSHERIDFQPSPVHQVVHTDSRGRYIRNNTVQIGRMKTYSSLGNKSFNLYRSYRVREKRGNRTEITRGVVRTPRVGMNDKRGPTLGETISQMELSASNHHFEERSICLTYYCICWWCNLEPAKKEKKWKVAKLHIGVCCRVDVWNMCRALWK